MAINGGGYTPLTVMDTEYCLRKISFLTQTKKQDSSLVRCSTVLTAEQVAVHTVLTRTAPRFLEIADDRGQVSDAKLERICAILQHTTFDGNKILKSKHYRGVEGIHYTWEGEPEIVLEKLCR